MNFQHHLCFDVCLFMDKSKQNDERVFEGQSRVVCSKWETVEVQTEKSAV